MFHFYFKKGKLLPTFLLLLFFLCSIPFFGACNQKIDYFDYVSELRRDIYLAKEGDFSLRVYALVKENPYAMDGIPKSPSPRMEAYMVAPDGTKDCHLTLEFDNQIVEGEMSYDNVKGEYFFAHSIDLGNASKLKFTLIYGEETIVLQALSVKNSDVLTTENILQSLVETEGELFRSLTDKYGFSGEIYLRLIYEDSPYYYVGIIERSGDVHAFLIHAKTGKVLAKRRP